MRQRSSISEHDRDELAKFSTFLGELKGDKSPANMTRTYNAVYGGWRVAVGDDLFVVNDARGVRVKLSSKVLDDAYEVRDALNRIYA